MEDKGVEKVMQVWETRNKITNPNQNHNLIKIVEQLAQPFAAGTFFYFVFDLENFEISHVSESIQNILGIEPEKFTLDYFFKILHPEDTLKINEKEAIALDFLLNRLTIKQRIHYKISYLMRLQHTNFDYITILHQVKPIVISKAGKIQKTLCVYTDVSYLHLPIDHKISMISNIYPSFFAIETEGKHEFTLSSLAGKFTKRELEVIQKLAQGKSSSEIAELLYLSTYTVNTHKKNILRKTDCKNTPELITLCVREGLI